MGPPRRPRRRISRSLRPRSLGTAPLMATDGPEEAGRVGGALVPSVVLPAPSSPEYGMESRSPALPFSGSHGFVVVHSSKSSVVSARIVRASSTGGPRHYPFAPSFRSFFFRKQSRATQFYLTSGAPAAA